MTNKLLLRQNKLVESKRSQKYFIPFVAFPESSVKQALKKVEQLWFSLDFNCENIRFESELPLQSSNHE